MRSLFLLLVLSLAHAVVAQTGDAATEALRAEMVFWESIRFNSDPADFRAYLEQYPNGRFAVLARNRLDTLTAQPSPSATQQTAPAATQSQDSRGGGGGGGRGRRGRQGTQQPQ
jgi:hypothetical protein